MALDRPLADLIRERAEALARFNDWERSRISQDDRDLASRLSWLGEAYDLARRLGALRPLPKDAEALKRRYEGVRLMQRHLSLLSVNKPHV